MRAFPGLLIPLLLPAAALLPSPEIATRQAGPVVRIDLPNDQHGSGAYIGRGMVLTAAHIAMPGIDLVAVDDDGKTYKATRMFVDPAKDIALIMISPAPPLKVAPLKCELPPPSTPVTITGYPLSFGKTMLGAIIASDLRIQEAFDGFHQPMFLLDQHVGIGMSGGPVRTSSGEIVGIVVAQAVTMRGVPHGISLASDVASTVCPLLKDAGVM